MNNIEETLWNYIDGTCTAQEQEKLAALIAEDERYRVKYQELLSLNTEFAAMELDEPPMAFTYNVMEAIRTEQAMVPLKAAINKRIIFGISIFFVLTIIVLLAVTLANINWQGALAVPDVSATLKLPDVKNIFSGPVIKGFFFFDVVLALFLVDAYLRKKIFFKTL